MNIDSLSGTYKFYEKNELVYQQKNSLTLAGRGLIIKSLLGILPGFAGTIAYGVGNSRNILDPSTNLAVNNSLDFEIGRVPVESSSLAASPENASLVYTGIIDDPFTYLIEEVGLFPPVTNNSLVGIQESSILVFDQAVSFTEQGNASATFLTANFQSRIGTEMYFLPQLNGTTDFVLYSAAENTLDYLDNFSQADTFRLALFNNSLNAASVTFRFFNDENNYYDVVFVTPSASGYHVVKTPKFSAVPTGTPKWQDLSGIKFFQNGAAEGVFLDAIKIGTGTYFIDTVTSMISRTALEVPIRKPLGIPLTIEYVLNVGFNIGAS